MPAAFAAVAVAGMLLLSSCQSAVLARVAAAETPLLKLIIARDMINQSRYILALRILQDLSDSVSDPAFIVEIDYERAFISLSRWQYYEAKEQFDTIIRQYEELENKNALPAWPYYLSKAALDTIVNPAVERREKIRKTLRLPSRLKS